MTAESETDVIKTGEPVYCHTDADGWLPYYFLGFKIGTRTVAVEDEEGTVLFFKTDKVRASPRVVWTQGYRMPCDEQVYFSRGCDTAEKAAASLTGCGAFASLIGEPQQIKIPRS